MRRFVNDVCNADLDMKCCAWAMGLLLLLSGCTFSRGIAYYRPSGTGKLAVDDREIPSTMEYGFGTGSVLTVSIKRKRSKADVTFTVHLRDKARFADDSGGVLFFCDGRQFTLPAPTWQEKRIKDGVAYVADHRWGEVLEAVNALRFANKPARGDYSTGDYRASLTMRDCKDLPFSLTLPTVTVGETVHEFGRVFMTPQMMPVTWTLPVPSRVEGSPR